ncbi:MAG: RluA family pseudouridine synthase [Deltaproteobacteria bacterium]|uniref:RluA family pseudouridine synthase n=1 Tax=Candidatus Zymogenus saltonus TaxID=2844893 RepID=A0A9D8KHA0_9DELT|nr:RluA family pseudouridine synthase [Candidatus Zymogenus saltonus]
MKNFIESILYDDKHLLAVIKPFGVLTQGDLRGGLSVFDAARDYIGEKHRTLDGPNDCYLSLLHRLDRPVGGVILFAKTPAAAKRLSEAFREREVKKTYLARIEGAVDPPSGELSHSLLKSGAKVSVVPEGAPGSKKALLFYRTLRNTGGDGESLIEIDLITGRRHQIRAQLSAVGHPVRGDIKYNSKNKFIPGGIALFSKSLTFAHPVTGEEMTITADPPEEFFIDF